MTRMTFRLAFLSMLAALVLLPHAPAQAAGAQSRRETMRSVGSDYSLKRLLRRVATEDEALQEEAGGPPPPPAPPPPPPPPAPAMAAAAPAPAPAAKADAAAPGITNVQTQGVDEGGIVKQHGKHLIVLRRGRLFSIDTSGGKLTLLDRSDAFPAFEGRNWAWYDEMLVSGDWVVVIGYNYSRGGTEINRFRIDDAGKFTLVDTYHLRSQDYYSAENYASRLVGNRLIVYTPLYFNRHDPIAGLPGMRRWTKGEGRDGKFTRTALAQDIYVPDLLMGLKRPNLFVYHSVTSCDLTAAEMACKAQVVLGSNSRTFYVGQDAVYVWTGDLEMRRWNDESPADPRGMLYRMPLDGSAPQAAVVWGGPVNQFGMRSEPDGTFHALVLSDYDGDAMWEPVKGRKTSMALLTLRPRDLGRGRGKPRLVSYTPLPGGGGGRLENRFVGDHLVYSVSGGGGYYDKQGWHPRNTPPMAYAVALKDRRVSEIEPGGVVTRIDQLGTDAILIGNGPGGALRFQSLAFDRPGGPAIIDRYDLPAAREGESRSQAFFYRPDNADGSDGMLGLPVASNYPPGIKSAVWYRAGIFFMHRKARSFVPAGTLDANPVSSAQDNCKASCVDWYGNARPIFLGGRIFALMGYELVEGRSDGGAISEVQRLDFNPAGDQQQR